MKFDTDKAISSYHLQVKLLHAHKNRKILFGQIVNLLKVEQELIMNYRKAPFT